MIMLTLFGAGMGMIFATIQVYFRDAASFLPYMVRIWLYGQLYARSQPNPAPPVPKNHGG